MSETASILTPNLPTASASEYVYETPFRRLRNFREGLQELGFDSDGSSPRLSGADVVAFINERWDGLMDIETELLNDERAAHDANRVREARDQSNATLLALAVDGFSLRLRLRQQPGGPVAYIAPTQPDEMTARAERIAACVNACAGLTTEQLREFSLLSFRQAAAGVVQNWERGDLAGAVSNLEFYVTCLGGAVEHA